MITISQPIIERAGGKTNLKAYVTNDVEQKHGWMWFSTNDENGKYFCEETADAFVLPMILRAVKTHQDIYVESLMSERLFYNLNNSLLYSVTKAHEKKYGKQYDRIIRIECNRLISTNFSPIAVGTGCSLGVDSFTVLKHHFLTDECPQKYKITHLALFNAGAFGSRDVDGARRSFEKEISVTKKFADYLGLPFVWVDSNVRTFFPELSFDYCVEYLNMSIVLSMQKLWKKYLYASAYPVDQFSFNIKDPGFYAPFLLPHLSTESTELVLASMNMNRSEKVKYISKEKIVQEKLNVCLKEQLANNPQIKDKYQGNYINCGRCKKCLRTVLQLDILSVLDEFSNIFDLGEWAKKKDLFIAEVIANKDNNYYMHDLYCSMLENDYVIPKASKRYAKRIIWNKRFHTILNRIKRILTRLSL